jgi:membrane-bound serine protease (ClpP class)
MKLVLWILTLALASLGFAAEKTAAPSRSVHVLPVTGPIGPATADFILRGIARAQEEGAELVVLQIDTPGGLDDSMRDIIKGILSSRVPVATFVAPSGARAASAGTYILYASPVAAMAPGTNLGAATPVAIGGEPPTSRDPFKPAAPEKDKEKEKDAAPLPLPDKGRESTMTRKQVHDAAAYIRSLAALHGRNAEWAERAVRESVSLSADEALKEKVIDLVASDVPDLLAKLDGRKVKTAAGERPLSTAGATLVMQEPDWRTRFLSVITHPSIALILMMIGVYGLMFEFMNPGMVLPGVVGAIALLIGLFALALLPVSYAGLALVLLGLSFMVAEVFLPSYGSLGIGGVIAFVVGALMLVDTDVPGFGIPLSLIVTLAVTSLAFILAVGAAALKARHRPVVSGREQLIGSTGTMLDDSDAEGWARVQGEQWRVRSPVPLRRGQPVRVTSREGLVLNVTPLDSGAH